METEPVNDWIDYEGGSTLSGQALKFAFAQALVKVYLTCNKPLFSDPLYNAYYQAQPALAERLAVLGPLGEDVKSEDVHFDLDPVVDDSDSEIAVPSIMLQA